jgi:hypothetical protein
MPDWWMCDAHNITPELATKEFLEYERAEAMARARQNGRTRM